MKRFFVFISLFFLQFPAFAVGNGTWCLVRDENSSCRFANADACYQAVARSGGYCQENFRAAGVKGDAAWCVVTSNRRHCTFAIQGACLKKAMALQGACVSRESGLQ